MSEYVYATDGDTVQNMLSEVFEPLQEIVRCKDCKWMSKDTVHYKACYRLRAIEFMVEPDGFCAWSERRD